MERFKPGNKTLEEFEDYGGFVEKFKPKKTTDDCYTPPAVYAAVLEWVKEEIGIADGLEVVRPFYPGGNYQAEDYAGKVVIDNPPFSISSEIINFYYAHGIPFFLFAPRMTCLSGRRAGMENLTAVFGCKDISYENGAVVPTAFLTNMMGDVKIRVSETLEAKLKAAMPSEKKALPRYAYPDNLIKAADLEQCGELEICRADTLPVNALDAQKPFGKTVFGKGLLLSDKAARAVKAAKAAKAARAARAAKAAKAANVIVWPLSEREQKLIERLNR
ncbi:TPA: hypothetical protein ACXIOD_001659 [Neisseria meningitidis]|uniref:hypothetical protein n=1 Tax=Neisseria meningitidis TaxID=487 RepID=UPI000766A4D6|nr:hypothetical protein [Neisseria meningitidis]MBJ7767567.1 hypothetical protein [Neisseria meningitidis]MBJ7872850.1 hypothetical protein [Neisseria meningitidis]MBJ7878164.1 hypothetical protein [Neisseria meningitidis]CWN73797.1 Uncharacterised protein [Neisseria meningitidis]CWR79384.1 Uncharacterised protein [Neisseria meningitidis]